VYFLCTNCFLLALNYSLHIICRYVLVYFSILFIRFRAGIVTREMLALPKSQFMLIGLLEALGAASGMAAAGNQWCSYFTVNNSLFKFVHCSRFSSCGMIPSDHNWMKFVSIFVCPRSYVARAIYSSVVTGNMSTYTTGSLLITSYVKLWLWEAWIMYCLQLYI